MFRRAFGSLVPFVVLLGFCVSLVPGAAYAYTVSQTQNQTSDGQNFTFTFTNIPRAMIATNLTVGVRVYGDYGGSTEFAVVNIDGAAQLPLHQGGTSDCLANGNNQNYSIGGAVLNDRAVTVTVNLSAGVSATQCANYQERVVVTLNYTERPTDLTISQASVTVPSGTVASGTDVTVNYTITNNGEPFSTDFQVRFYYCRQNNSTTCTQLQNRTITANFNTTQNRARTETLTLPNTVVRGTGYIRVRVDSTDVVEEGTNENNNSRWASFTVNGRPDLIFSSFSISPTTNVAPGSTITIQYAVRNAGNTRAQGAFVVRFYYATSSTATTGTPVVNITVNSLNAGVTSPATGSVSTTITVPTGATLGSTRYIHAFVDADNDINNESNGANNRDVASFTVTSLPDLDISAVSYNTAGAVGAGLAETLAFSIRNRGAAVSTDFGVRFWYCPRVPNPATATTGCTAIGGTRTITDNFTNQQVRNYTQSLTLPNSVRNGVGHIRVQVDTGSAVNEADEDNNQEYDSFIVNSRPDLRINIVSVTPTSQYPGADLTVNYRVRNAGRARAEGFVIRFYYSTNNTLGGDTTLHTTTAQNLNALSYAPSSTTTTSQTVTIPTGATPGSTRYIFAYVDPVGVAGGGTSGNVTECTPLPCTQETNNTDVQSFTVTDSNPDLDVTAATVTPATAAGSGSAVSLAFTIRNRFRNTSTDFDVRFYYCRQQNTTTCTRLAPNPDRTITANFSSFQTRNFTQSLTLPANVIVGTGYIRVRVDSGSDVTETDETNNDAWAAVTINGKPDLRPIVFSVAPASGTPGASVQLSYRVQNNGVVRATSIRIRFYYSADASIDIDNLAAETYLGVQRSVSLNAGATSVPNTATVTIPASAAAGARSLYIVVDYNKQIDESDETNNTRRAAFTVSAVTTEAGPEPTPEPTPEPASEPTPTDTGTEPTPEPAAEPTPTDAGAEPTAEPSTEPTAEPSTEPTAEPSTEPAPTDAGTEPSPDAAPDTGAEPTGDAGPSDSSDPCTGVTCNADEVCKAGTCTRICGCTQCAANEKCEDGTCVTDPCGGVTCSSGEVCDSSGQCITDPCATVSCSSGQVCKGGSCVADPCAGLNCPQGNQCVDGQCVGTNCGEATEGTGETTTDAGGEGAMDVVADGGSEATGDGQAGDMSADADPGDGTADAGPTDDATADGTVTDDATSDDATSDDATTDDATNDDATNDGTASDDATNDGTGSDAGGGDAGGNEGGADTGSGTDLGISDRIIGGDGSGSNNDNAPVAGGCCQIAGSQQVPLFWMLLFLVLFLAPSLRRQR